MMGDHLTEPNPTLGKLVRNTPAGMAHWAGTGPAGKTCEDCAFFRGKVRRTGIGVGEVQPGRCSKYIKMNYANTPGRAPNFVVPPKTPSCKYFELVAKPAAKG